MPEVPPVEPVYRTLATLPRGPVIEMPFFYPQVGLFQHTKYMLASTAHWMPLVNGYSDYIPPDFYEHVDDCWRRFPAATRSRSSSRTRVRYAVFHMYGYNTENRNDVLTRAQGVRALSAAALPDDDDQALRDRGVSAVARVEDASVDVGDGAAGARQSD